MLCQSNKRPLVFGLKSAWEGWGWGLGVGGWGLGVGGWGEGLGGGGGGWGEYSHVERSGILLPSLKVLLRVSAVTLEEIEKIKKTSPPFEVVHVSYRDQLTLEPNRDWSPLGVPLQFSDKHP